MKRMHPYLKLILLTCFVAFIAYSVNWFIDTHEYLIASFYPSEYDVPAILSTPVSFDESSATIDTSFLKKNYRIPNDSYLSFYFEKNQDTQNILNYKDAEYRNLICYNNVDKIFTIQNQFDKKIVDPRNFVGYWVGEIDFPKSSFYNFYTSGNASLVKILIDGKEVLNSSDSENNKKFYVSSFYHKVEIIAEGNSDKFNFFYSAEPIDKIYNEDDTAKLLKENFTSDMDIYYISVKNSSAKDYKIVLDASGNKKDVAIVLDSYYPVNWDISNTNDSPIKTVVYNSYYGQSSVTARLKAKIYNSTYLTTMSNTFDSSVNPQNPPYSNISDVILDLQNNLNLNVVNESSNSSGTITLTPR